MLTQSTQLINLCEELSVLDFRGRLILAVPLGFELCTGSIRRGMRLFNSVLEAAMFLFSKLKLQLENFLLPAQETDHLVQIAGGGKG